MMVAAFLTGFLSLTVLGTVASLAYRQSPLLWIILGCVLFDAGALGFFFSAGFLR